MPSCGVRCKHLLPGNRGDAGAPGPLADAHELAAFDSGVPSLDDRLKRRARANQSGGATRTFVVAEAQSRHRLLRCCLRRDRRRQCVRQVPAQYAGPIPVALLARLAIDRAWQGQGLGRALFRDCAARIVHAADTLGIRGIIVHAISEQAKPFYLAIGFEPSPLDPMLLMVTLSDVRAILGTTGE